MRIISIIEDIIAKVVDETGRTQRQWLVIKRWANALFHGTFVACTGFGKTRVGLYAIKLLRRSNPERKVIVVVPGIPLQEQWQKLLKKWKLEENTEVWVINSLSAEKVKHNCSLLVCDEIHRYAAETFKRVFDVVEYTYIIGMTATIERSDGKHVLLEKFAPVIDEVPLHVARAKGWVAEYEIFNYGIELPEPEQDEYDKLYGSKSKLITWMPLFDYDIQLIIKCSFNNKPRYDKATGQMYDSPPVKIARSMGWRGNTAYQALLAMRRNKEAPRGQKENIWGGDLNHIYHPDKIVGYAVQARKLISARKQFISNHYLKTKAVIDIYHLLKLKTISFSETRQVADELYTMVGEKHAVKYYSKMPSIKMMVTKTKEYKRRASVDRFIEKHPDTDFELIEKNGIFILSWQEEKTVGEKIQKEEALRKLIDNRYNIDFISSVRALNEGIDIPDLGAAIIHSRDSVARNTVQRIGRVARLFIYKDGSKKKPIIVNIYLKNTKDEDWLRTAMRKILGAIWIDDISEIIERDDFEMVA